MVSHNTSVTGISHSRRIADASSFQTLLPPDAAVQPASFARHSLHTVSLRCSPQPTSSSSSSSSYPSQHFRWLDEIRSLPITGREILMETDMQRDGFAPRDHQATYILDPGQDGARPPKRRRGNPASGRTKAQGDAELFAPLLNGLERREFVKLRQRRFEEAWDMVDRRIQGILRDSNSATLAQVADFVASAETQCADRIPAALIVTGPNIASQDLLFEQLSKSLQRTATSRFVRLKSSETVTLKAALKKTIRDATARRSDGVDEETVQNGRRYLDYDLEALEAFIKPSECKHVFVAFQDSEAFESSLLSDLITLFHSWRPRIPFTLLFGIATSVDLLQLRLLKSACRLMYGGRFDGVQTAGILEAVFKGTVAAFDVPLRLGAPILQSMLERQREQVAGIQSFVSSLKFAYMCHFYANPLSILCSAHAATQQSLQQEHLAAVRNLTSFRNAVEQEVERSTHESLHRAKAMIEDDEYLLGEIRAGHQNSETWTDRFLRSLLVLQAAGALRASFSDAYVQGMMEGAQLSPDHPKLVHCIRRMTPDELIGFLQRVLTIFQEGDASLHLGPATNEHDASLVASLQRTLLDLETLQAQAEQAQITLRSKYGGHGKVVRTTVIAQKVQLSQDSAALRDEDRKLTEMMDNITSLISTHYPDTDPHAVLLAECWLYTSKSPSRDVFVPRPRAAFERSLERPQDYLGSSCPKAEGGETSLHPGLPPTSILYQLYLECGRLINVADLWTAFYGIVGQEEEDERKALVMFYRGLAELRALGFVKSSKKKVDHIAKIKWL